MSTSTCRRCIKELPWFAASDLCPVCQVTLMMEPQEADPGPEA